MMCGQIRIQSEVGKGSTFWFTAALPAQPSVERAHTLSLAGKRVLLIADHRSSRLVITEFLTLWQCGVEESLDTEHALGLLNDSAEQSFDAIIIDLKSRDAGARICSNPRFSSTPIVLITPLQEAVPVSAWERAAYVARVTKPLMQDEFGKALASASGVERGRGNTALVAPAVSRRKEDRSQHRLLVVEDNLVNQEVVMGLVEHLGYRADVVADGQSALRALRQTAYPLVLMDCQMPEMDGYEAARSNRNPITKVLDPGIPIIALTAHSLAGDREKCLLAGMEDYLTKRIRPELLAEVLTRWTSADVLPGAVIASEKISVPLVPGRLETEQPGERPFDPGELVERLMGNEALAKRVAGAFIDSMPQQLAAPAKAIHDFDAPVTVPAAQHVRGAVANVGGMVEIWDLASKVEKLEEAGALTAAFEVLSELTATFASLQPQLQRFFDGESRTS